MVRNVSRTALSARRAGPAVVLLALSLAAAACQTGRPGNTPQATVPKAVGTNPTPATRTAYAPADPYTVPSVITKAYVQKVLNALEVVNAQATDLIVANKALVPPAADRLRSIYTGSEFTAQTAHLLTVISTGVNRTFQSNPGAIVDTVNQIVSADPGCIYLGATRDYSHIAVAPSSPRFTFISLVRRTEPYAQSDFNPTSWVFSFIGYNTDGSAPSNPCPAASS